MSENFREFLKVLEHIDSKAKLYSNHDTAIAA